jgi:ubiquinone/menaquinone biosynthesis C-methylase UbiE
MSSASIHKRVTDQFAPTASSYATSGVHANSAELTALVELAQPKVTDLAIDVATGAGHMALAFAPCVAEVTAFDLTQSMLDQTLETAQARGLTNIKTVQGAAEQLPFEDESFDLYTVRLAPHHFADIDATIREAARVLRPGGKYLVVDTTSPEDDLLDTQLNEIELLRDPSHIRNYRSSEWREMLEAVGLEIVHRVEGKCGELEFADWTRRQDVPDDRLDILRCLFTEASPRLTKALDIRFANGTIYFTLPQVTILAIKPA